MGSKNRFSAIVSSSIVYLAAGDNYQRGAQRGFEQAIAAAKQQRSSDFFRFYA